MSGANITYDIPCKIGNGNENIKFEDRMLNENTRKMANMIAGEVVNEILENALDIATRASETGIHWSAVKGESNLNLSTYNSRILLDEKGEEITSRMEPNLCDKFNILDIKKYENVELNQSEPLSLDSEMRHLLSEMIGTHYNTNANYEAVPAKGGVGDQPSKITEQVNFEETDKSITEKPPLVEKKSSATNLINNSNEILKQHILNEALKQSRDEWEESEEQLIQTIDLEYDRLTNNLKNQSPENTPLPVNDDKELLETPANNVMDMVDFTSKVYKDNEDKEQMSFKGDHIRIKGAEYVNYDVIKVLPPHDTTHNIESVSIMHVQSTTSKNDAKDSKDRKKKWSLGTRIMNFFKRYPKSGN